MGATREEVHQCHSQQVFGARRYANGGSLIITHPPTPTFTRYVQGQDPGFIRIYPSIEIDNLGRLETIAGTGSSIFHTLTCSSPVQSCSIDIHFHYPSLVFDLFYLRKSLTSCCTVSRLYNVTQSWFIKSVLWHSRQ